MIAVNKADDDRGARQRGGRRIPGGPAHPDPGLAPWTPPVLTVSGLTGQGLDASGRRSSTTAAPGRDRRIRGEAQGAGHEMDVGAGA